MWRRMLNCSDGVIRTDFEAVRAEVIAAMRNKLATFDELSYSDIVRTIFSVLQEERRELGAVSLYVYSDLIENSDYFPSKYLFSYNLQRSIFGLQHYKLIPDLKGATVQVGGPGWHGARGHWASVPLDPAMVEDRADRMVRHLSIELDANNEQQEKLRVIVRGMLKDVLPTRERALAARGQARELLTATTIDRTALEKLRADQIALADSVSKRITQAIGDAGEVLNFEQRRKLADLSSAGRPRHGHDAAAMAPARLIATCF